MVSLTPEDVKILTNAGFRVETTETTDGTKHDVYAETFVLTGHEGCCSERSINITRQVVQVLTHMREYGYARHDANPVG